MELTCLKVKIGLRKNGQAAHPFFNQLPIVKASGLDWSFYVDQHGHGWQYDKTSGHKESSTDSPNGMQWGCLAVPEQFAVEAVAFFPNLCTRMNEVDFEAFYNDKAHSHEQETLVDTTIVQGLKDSLDLLERSLSDPPTPTEIENIKILKTKIKRAMDPMDSEPGISVNTVKTWSQKKAVTGVTIKNPV